MKDKKTVLFSAFRRVVPADFENWLERMAKEGWHINHIGQWSSIAMTFRRGEPKNYRFVYDVQALPRKEYIPTYEQFGWECLGRMASVYIWRMEYDDKRPEVFSDKDSTAARTQRTINAIWISFSIFALTMLIMAVPLIFFKDTISASDRTQLIAAEVFSGILTALLGAVMVQIRKNRDR